VADDRLIETSELPLERNMLRAAAEETAPFAARRRALAKLGLLAVAPPAAAASTAGVASAATAQTVGKLGWLAKLGLMASLGGAAVGAVALDGTTQPPKVSTTTRAPETKSTPNTGIEAKSGPTSAPKIEEKTLGEATRTIPETAARVRTQAGVRKGSASSIDSQQVKSAETDAARAASIRSEIDLLDRARSAVARGTHDAAIAILDEYAARHPRGELSAEAALVRVEAVRARDRGARKTPPAL